MLSIRRLLFVFLAGLTSLPLAAQTQCPSNLTAAQPSSPSGTNFAPGDNVTFTWTASSVSGVTYDVVAWQTIANPITVCADTTATACTGQFTPSGQWNWVVKTKKISCTDQPSTQKTFTIGCLSANPSLQSPSNNATNVPANVTLTWSAVAGADSYDIYVSPTASGSCGSNGQLASSNTTSYTPPTLQDGTQYGWRVVAKKSGCPSTTSTCGTFTTAASTCNLPGAFDLRAPNNLTVGSTPQLSWNGANNAFKYIVHIGTSNPPQPSANDPLVSGTSYTPTTPLSPGTYYWNVDAYASCNTSSPTRSTSTYTFTVRSCPTAAANLTSPADGASIPSSTPVTFNWIGTVSALSYDVMVSNDGGATFTSVGNSTSSSFTKSLLAGNYVWYVRTNYDSGCASVNSQASRFSVTQTTCPTTPPVLTSPADKAVNVTLPVTLTWNGVAGATGYRIFASQNGNVTLLGSTTDATRFITSAVPTGTVTWWVVALFDNCASLESSKFTFTTATTNCP